MSAIAPHHPQNPIAYSLKSNSDRPFTSHNPDRLFPASNSDRPSPPINLIAYTCLASFELELGNVDLFYDLEIKYASIP
ncbi:MAG: hypothetical protein IM537_17725 [Pseudanabaena sp. M57BS1SP1A06MG]|nr:hypothetical protein [Pseudanabaena sp. M53BS1SP1A06MG]MCA6583351.1 hypothetical protein [Pseudanabaena sp. M34BS1SP1A06MG]MCA6593877.1 hypothetical protein [Pseudanabaena sp. M38BS1SP1A06MG]MCA6601992.1 hypothetical protein [Pseudanabaena sp. M57BS1SP1A06MG]